MAIRITNLQKKIKPGTRRLRCELQRILDILGCGDHDVSLLLVDDEGMRNLNRRYLDRDRPTNVISFPMREGEFRYINPRVLGDIVISVETARRDAEKGLLALEDEIDYLMIHAVLHLLGYEHEASGTGARKMRQKEREIFLALKGYQIE
ncbi:MAG: rRNA maturation RNase YbeY [Syntrophales bacterium]